MVLQLVWEKLSEIAKQSRSHAIQACMWVIACHFISVRVPLCFMLFIRKITLSLHIKGGQEPIIHLVANFSETIAWANKNEKRWAFTDSNAASDGFNAYSDVNYLDKLQWDAIVNDSWSEPSVKHYKQAEFLIEKSFPVQLIRGIAVHSEQYQDKVSEILTGYDTNIETKVIRDWYY